MGLAVKRRSLALGGKHHPAPQSVPTESRRLENEHCGAGAERGFCGSGSVFPALRGPHRSMGRTQEAALSGADGDIVSLV